MTIAALVLGLMAQGNAPIGHVPVADADFIRQAAAVELDWKNATDFFVVAPATGIRPAGKADTELKRMEPWLKKMAKPELARELGKSGWVAYKDATHRLEPLIAECKVGVERIRWSFSAKSAALLVDLAEPTGLQDADSANRFALAFLERLLLLPARPDTSVKALLGRHGALWGGYVSRGRMLSPSGYITTPWEWDTHFLVITDGRHVLVRWVLMEPEDQFGKGETGHASGARAPKTKSRFDE